MDITFDSDQVDAIVGGGLDDDGPRSPQLIQFWTAWESGVKALVAGDEAPATVTVSGSLEEWQALEKQLIIAVRDSEPDELNWASKVAKAYLLIREVVHEVLPRD